MSCRRLDCAQLLESEDSALKTRVARLDTTQLEKDLADVNAANKEAEARLLHAQMN